MADLCGGHCRVGGLAGVGACTIATYALLCCTYGRQILVNGKIASEKLWAFQKHVKTIERDKPCLHLLTKL